jgi:hypothetical protein
MNKHQVKGAARNGNAKSANAKSAKSDPKRDTRRLRDRDIERHAH